MRSAFTTLLVLLFCTINAAAQNTESDTLRFDDGSWYVGGIVDSLFNGKGTMQYSDGTLYSGDWKNGLWDGKGELTFPDGDHYSGGFKEHKMSGEGVYKYANGAEYSGDWENNMFNGVGTLLYEDGGYYTGIWKDDMRHGAGILYSIKDNTVYRGYFENDVYVGKSNNEETAATTQNKQETSEEQFNDLEDYIIGTFSLDVAMATKDMLVIGFSISNYETFWGLTLTTNTAKRTFGLDIIPYNVDEVQNKDNVIGWEEYQDEEFVEGKYNAYSALFNFGWYLDDFVQFGINVGLSIENKYKNCVAGDYGIFERNTLYFKTSFSNVYFNYGTFVRYSIGFTDKLYYNLVFGMNKIEGIYTGIGIQF